MMILCGCGRFHFGRYGAAGLVLMDAERLLLTYRSRFVHHPGTWALPGGALAMGETATAAALREAREEIGIGSEHLTMAGEVVGTDHGAWRYTYVLARLRNPRALPTLVLNWETTAAEWVPVSEVGALPLHPGLAATWDVLREAL